MPIGSYPSIYHIGHRVIKDIFSTPVVVEEKIDGSQFSFRKNEDGTFEARSKGCQIYPDSCDKLFAPALVTMIARMPALIPSWTYRGEAVCKPKHNTLSYSRVPNGGFILFDIDNGLQDYFSRADKEEEAERLELEIVPALYVGKVDSFEQLTLFLERESVLGGSKIEGFVVKNYDLFGPDKKIMLGKFVSEAFKEKHGVEWKNSNPGKNDILANLITIYRHENRWNKAVQHLRDSGTLNNDPSDIGKLIKEIPLDVYKEEKENIEKQLMDWAWKHISRGITAGFPEWYKEQLAKGAFNE